MRRIDEIMEDIRGKPVCPDTGEMNLYWLIQEHKQARRKDNDLHRTDKPVLVH